MPIIHLWALVAIMVLSVILGFIWYGPLFGKKWMKLSGIVMPNKKPSMGSMWKPIVLSFVGSFLLGYVLSALIAFHNAYYLTSGYGSEFSFAFLVWLGFMVPVYLNLKGWEGKSWTLFWINAGYWLVFLMIASALIVAIT